jgi:Tfp pilus assembly protein PilF
VLEGSVEALPGRVRANAQLIDAKTNTHVWSERLEREGDDVFALEAEITNRIANTLAGHDQIVSTDQRAVIRRKPPSSWSAYDAYQAGLEASHQMNNEFVPQAEAMFSRSLEIDPNFARAHVGMAWVHFLKILFGPTPPEVSLPSMVASAQKAVALDPDDGEAHAVLAQAYLLLKDTDNMEVEANRALALAPGNADILVITSLQLAQAGHSDQALANVDKALSLNPAYPFWYNTTLYATLFYAGDFGRSYAFGKEAAKAAPVNSDFLAMDAAMLGRKEEAAMARAALGSIDPDWSVERLLTNFGNLKGETERNRLLTAATRAGLRICLTKPEIATLANAVTLPQCDAERATD